MAQQKSNNKRSSSKGTSFGKKSGAEKAFRTKKKPNESFGGERRSSSGPSAFAKPFRKAGGSEEGDRSGGFSKSRPDSGGGDFKKPFQKREGGSFGARSEGPKRFSKPFNSEGGEEKPFRKSSNSSPSFSRQGSFGKADGDFKRPYKKREEGSSESGSEKPRFSKPFRSEGGDEKPYRKTGSASGSFGRPTRFDKSTGKSEGEFKRPYKKREEGASDSERPRFSKPFRSEGGEDKPFRKTSSSSPSFGSKGSFGKSEGDFKRPYKKREEGSSESSSEKSGYSKPFRSEGGEDKPFRKTGGATGSFGRPTRFDKSTDKPEGDFKRSYKKRDEGSSESDAERPRSSKPFGAEGKEDKPFRKTGSSASSFGRPDKFEKSEGSKRYTDDFKKPFKKDGDSSEEERPKRFERKSNEEGEHRSFVQKRVYRSAKSFKPKVWDEKPSDGTTRLNKYIANSGVCSRREADNLITMGLISVNKVTITELGYKVKPGEQVRYEDKLLKAEKPVYILLNKPKGFITTTDDPQERNTVMNLVANACKERIYPVGRLDRNTTGLLLLTNDGDLAEKLMHPSFKAKKIYKVELDKPITKNDFIKIQEGVHLPEGKAIVDDLQMITDDSKTVGIEIHIGWNRVVRRIFESLGYDVVRLDRSVYAGLDKKEIGRGEWRFLKPEEIVRLKHFKG